jgi:hypothetical protein
MLYRFLYILVQMVNWDLSRDADTAKYAETIVEAHEMTVDLPEQALNHDKDNLRLIRRLNSLRIIQVRNISTSTRVTEEQIETVQEIQIHQQLKEIGLRVPLLQMVLTLVITRATVTILTTQPSQSLLAITEQETLTAVQI